MMMPMHETARQVQTQDDIGGIGIWDYMQLKPFHSFHQPSLTI
jgi:hypothetical protein